MLDTEDPNNLTPEQIQQLMDAGVSADKIAQLTKQSAKNQDTYDAALSGDNLKGYGSAEKGSFVANNPLEFLVEGVRGYKANKESKMQDKQADALRQGQADARGLYMNTGILGRNADPNMRAMGMDAQMRPDQAHNIQDVAPPDMSSLGAETPGLKDMATALRARVAKKADAAAPGKHQVSDEEFLADAEADPEMPDFGASPPESKRKRKFGDGSGKLFNMPRGLDKLFGD